MIILALTFLLILGIILGSYYGFVVRAEDAGSFQADSPNRPVGRRRGCTEDRRSREADTATQQRSLAQHPVVARASFLVAARRAGDSVRLEDHRGHAAVGLWIHGLCWLRAGQVVDLLHVSRARRGTAVRYGARIWWFATCEPSGCEKFEEQFPEVDRADGSRPSCRSRLPDRPADGRGRNRGSGRLGVQAGIRPVRTSACRCRTR